MTDDRASLGARIAEAMGWMRYDQYGDQALWESGVLIEDIDYAEPYPELFRSEDLLSWEGYGRVDAWMREQGYSCIVRRDAYISVLYWDPRNDAEGYATNHEGDEPLAAICAALTALEARE